MTSSWHPYRALGEVRPTTSSARQRTSLTEPRSTGAAGEFHRRVVGDAPAESALRVRHAGWRAVISPAAFRLFRHTLRLEALAPLY